MIVSADRTKQRARRNSHVFCALLCVCVFIGLRPSLSALPSPPYPVRIDDISFSGGIGRGPTSPAPDTFPTYYRGYGLSGTNITLTASMDTGSGFSAPMFGDTTFTVSYAGGSFTVVIPSGAHSATATIPYTGMTVSEGVTTRTTYSVTAVSGTYAGTLTSAVTRDICWNYKALHDSAAPASPRYSVTETSITFFWPPVDTATSASNYGSDFYEYRIYYRKQGTTVFKQWNGSNDASMRGLASNPYPPSSGDASSHFTTPPGTPAVTDYWKYTTLSSLQLFTAYEFYITAADIFGNETALTDGGNPTVPLGIATLPLKLTASITDGITAHSDFTTLNTASFPPATPLRPLRAVNTRIDIYTVTTQSQPDQCVVWFAPYSPSITAPLVTGTLDANIAGLGADIDSVIAVRTGANKWTAYLPTIPSAGKNQIIREGTYVRFEVQLFSKGISTFVDRDSSKTGNTPWDYYVGSPAVAVSYPAKIFNNVLSAANPTAYPSYYLTEDAYVTIRVYDIKGRPVATLLDGAFRRGGVNIKENGWDGSNKANRKLGVGLYYMNFSAKSAANGKVILDDTKKLVMKH